MTESPTIVKARSAADLLAMLPHLASGTLSSGIAIAPFAGKRTPSVLRHPLPRSGTTRELRSIATTLLGMISRLGGCDAVLIAIYADEEFDVALDEHSELAQVLLQRFHSAGFGVLDVLLVAHDGWSRFDEGERRELSEIAESPVQMEWDQHAVTRSRHDGTLPATDPRLAAEVALTLIESAHGVRVDSFGNVTPRQASDPVAAFEATLALGAHRLGQERIATMTQALHSEGDFDRVLTQVFLGPERAAEVWARTLARRQAAASGNAQPIDLMRGEHRRGTRGDDEVADLLSGRRGVRPDLARIDAAIAVLSRTAAHAPINLRPMILCTLAWLHWSIGLGSCAARLLQMSARIDPDHEMTAIVSAITLSVMLPARVLERDLREETAASSGNKAGLNRAARRARGK